MANPTEVGVDDGHPVIVATSTTKASLTLNKQKQYSIRHLGVNVSNVADTNTVCYTTDDAGATPTLAAGADKGALTSTTGEAIVGPGLTKLTVISLADIPALIVTPISLQRGLF